MVCNSSIFKSYVLKNRLKKLQKHRDENWQNLARLHSSTLERVDDFESLFPEVFSPIDHKIEITRRALERLKKFN